LAQAILAQGSWLTRQQGDWSSVMTVLQVLCFGLLLTLTAVSGDTTTTAPATTTTTLPAPGSITTIVYNDALGATVLIAATAEAMPAGCVPQGNGNYHKLTSCDSSSNTVIYQADCKDTSCSSCTSPTKTMTGKIFSDGLSFVKVTALTCPAGMDKNTAPATKAAGTETLKIGVAVACALMSLF